MTAPRLRRKATRENRQVGFVLGKFLVLRRHLDDSAHGDLFVSFPVGHRPERDQLGRADGASRLGSRRLSRRIPVTMLRPRPITRTRGGQRWYNL
jgi:hypothetical protein